MPHTDYHDPEIPFPRLEVRIQKVELDAYWLHMWLWEKPGQRHELVNGKRAGSFRDAHEIIDGYSREYGAEVGPDDITIGKLPEEDA